MKKSPSDELLPEYDLSKLTGGVRGKYFQRASTHSNVIVLEPDVAKVFHDPQAVNGALRMLMTLAKSSTKRRPTGHRKVRAKAVA